MVREDLVEGAVTFLQDPSVASAPVEQKLAFLRSKNLTQEEIDASLARAGQASSIHNPPPSGYQQQQYRQPPPQYGGYQQPPYWGQAPPEPPQRDWRDWFIMATVLSGAGCAMYWAAKRYIYPLIAPPTPPQLEQDKASIDASFDKAFALLEQLATDTQELKDAEVARKERLDSALSEVEMVITKMKDANDARELEARRMVKEMADIREQIPQAIQREKDSTDEKLKDLNAEVKSLKTLVANRMGQTARPTPNSLTSSSSAGVGSSVASAPPPVPGSNGVNGVNGMNGAHDTAEKTASVLPERSGTASPYNRMLGSGKPQIPAWQLAAKKNSEEAKKDRAAGGGVLESGTAAEAEVAE